MNRNAVWISGAGLALLVGFFLPWIDLGAGSMGQVSGLRMVTAEELSWVTRIAILLTPILGISLLVAGLSGSRSASSWSLGVGSAILGFTVYKVADAFFAISGVGLWLVLSAGVVAVIAGLLRKPVA